jgi:hypothetical protein
MNIEPAVRIPSTVVPKRKQPGQTLFVSGLAVLSLGIFLAFLAMSSRIYEAGEYHPGNPMAGILLVVVGVGLLVAGFCRRLLAALER